MTTKHPILLVDDEPEILFSLQGLLRREFELHTAQSGAEALDILQRQPVHVIMTDQRMPGMSGVELLRNARNDCPEAMRLLFTGYADIKAVIEAVNHGQVYRYLTKPWDPDDLLATLHQACDHYTRIAEQKSLLIDVRAELGPTLEKMARHSFEAVAEKQFVQAGNALLWRLDQALTRSKTTCHLASQ